MTGARTVGDALHRAELILGLAGCDTPRLDAEVLLGHASGLGRADLIAGPEESLNPGAAAAFEALVTRRSGREPVAYLTGCKGFRHIDLEVDQRVLVPRPETELLVDAALELPQGARVLDVGTGSGAVALALKHERADLRVTGSDVSEAALVVARANGDRLGLDVTWVEADVMEGLEGPWDAVVSNPPYVAEADVADLAPEVAVHEPSEALFAGPDGLDVIRRLIAQAAVARVPFLALEVGAGQADAVSELMVDAAFGELTRMPDLAGIDRVVTGTPC